MKKILSTGIALIAMGSLPLIALAQVTLVNTNANATTAVSVRAAGVSAGIAASTTATVSAKNNRIATAKEHASQEITRRINNLTKLQTRIENAAHISSDDKAALSLSITGQITAMQNLRQQIAADSSTSSVRADIQSITKNYRIYMLIIPQSAVVAAADRVNDVASLMSGLASKIEARLAASANADASAALSDMQTKISEAKAQSSAAVAEVLSLKPDNGDKTIRTSNTATLKDARTKIQAAQQDLVAARKDVTTILHALKVNASANASAHASASSSAR